MATVELSEQNFESTILEGGIVLVDFWAAWCGPCLAFAPIYGAAAEDNEDIVFGKVDTEAHPQLSAAFNIRSIPTPLPFFSTGATAATSVDAAAGTAGDCGAGGGVTSVMARL